MTALSKVVSDEEDRGWSRVQGSRGGESRTTDEDETRDWWRLEKSSLLTAVLVSWRVQLITGRMSQCDRRDMMFSNNDELLELLSTHKSKPMLFVGSRLLFSTTPIRGVDRMCLMQPDMHGAAQ